MSNAREQITAIIENTDYMMSYQLADAIIAALPGLVKPLEWMDSSFEQDADFVDTTQTYQIQEGVFWYAAEVTGHVCGSNGAAMVAAQRHHVAQIMAAFGIDAAAMKEGKDA